MFSVKISWTLDEQAKKQRWTLLGSNLTLVLTQINYAWCWDCFLDKYVEKDEKCGRCLNT